MSGGYDRPAEGRVGNRVEVDAVGKALSDIPEEGSYTVTYDVPCPLTA